MNTSNTHCPICGQGSHFLLENSAAYDIRRCDSCAHVFVANPPSAEQVRAFYADFSYFEDNYNHQGIATIEGDEQWTGWLDARLSALDNYLPADFLARGKLEVLEIGCLEGRLLNALRSRGHAVHGCDVNPEVGAAGSTSFGLDIRLGEFLDCEFSPAAFDLVVSFHSFEHMVDPLAALKKTKQLLSAGGHVLLELPANDLEYENLQHFHFFTAESVNRMFDTVFGNCTIHDNLYTTAHGVTMGSIYVVGKNND